MPVRSTLIALSLVGCLAPVEPSPGRSADPAPSGSVPPPPSAPSRSPAATTPTELPTFTPLPAPSGGTILVTIPSQFGDLHITVEHDGILARARPATAAEINQVDMGEGRIVLRNVTETRLLLVWIGSVCERFATLTVERQRVVLAPAPRPGCDASAFGWGLVVTTNDPWDAAAVETIQLPTTLLP